MTFLGGFFLKKHGHAERLFGLDRLDAYSYDVKLASSMRTKCSLGFQPERNLGSPLGQNLQGRFFPVEGTKGSAKNKLSFSGERAASNGEVILRQPLSCGYNKKASLYVFCQNDK